MADECTDIANKEQFTINIRWGVSEDLESTDANCLVFVIKEALLWIELQLSACRGQCYDGASNMSGNRNGVATQISTEEKRAIYVHC